MMRSGSGDTASHHQHPHHNEHPHHHNEHPDTSTQTPAPSEQQQQQKQQQQQYHHHQDQPQQHKQLSGRLAALAADLELDTLAASETSAGGGTATPTATSASSKRNSGAAATAAYFGTFLSPDPAFSLSPISVAGGWTRTGTPSLGTATTTADAAAAGGHTPARSPAVSSGGSCGGGGYGTAAGGGGGSSSVGGGSSGSGAEAGGGGTLLQILPKLPSSDSLNNSPGPSSPGINDFSPFDKLMHDSMSSTKLTRKESYKAQRKNYRNEKKRVTNELWSSLRDPSVVVLADWLKIRGKLKSWTKLWCVLYPGMLLLYKNPKTKGNHWVGTILLNTCKVIERPSKKDGFCFKLYNPLNLSIWAPRGPDNENLGAVVQPLPTSYSIFRAPSQASGMCWLDALEISIRNDGALVRSVSDGTGSVMGVAGGGGPVPSTPGSVSAVTPGMLAHSGRHGGVLGSGGSASAMATTPLMAVAGDRLSINHETQWSEADYERHFVHDLDDASQPENGGHLSTGDAEITDSESEVSGKEEEHAEEEHTETQYAPNIEEEFGDAGAQIEELAEENKSLIWFLVKQVRPGMDLSKVVLPTFILEPRSFLDKLTDCYYHVDILSKAVLEDDAFTRMKAVVRWYLSGFYKKPKGLKKPYNPILGETFRCYWLHPSGSKTFYIAEQVSHHPPVSAFYVTNRQDGFTISASILAKSKFYGNSTSAILDGTAVLTLLPRGENYTLTIPYAHCKGILMGTLTMELGGKVQISCEKTGYHTEIEFKVKPFLGGAEQTNCISGRLKLGKETLATLEGFWDGVIYIKDRRTGDVQVLWHPTAAMRKSRLTRYTVPIDHQGEHESERLWQHVSSAILREDMAAATEEKTHLEEIQRALSKERKAKCEEWMPTHFQQDLKSGQWVYRHSDLRPWDPRNDLFQFESGYEILTRTKHATPMIRTASLTASKRKKKKLTAKQVSSDADAADNDDDPDDSVSESAEYHSDSTHSGHKKSITTNLDLLSAIQQLDKSVSQVNDRLQRVEDSVQALLAGQTRLGGGGGDNGSGGGGVGSAGLRAMAALFSGGSGAIGGGGGGFANYSEVVAAVFAIALFQTAFLYYLFR